MNARNHEIADADRREVKQAWELHRTWAEANYRVRTLIAIGDFHVARRPPQSILQPQPQRARLALDSSMRQQQPFW
eukprot:6897168-Pyramimonas_sp.AAC.1